MSAMTSNDQQAKIWSDTFQRDGYIARIDALDSRDESAELKENFDQLEKDTGKPNAQYSLHNVQMKLPWVMKLATHPNVLRPIQAILGNDVILLDSRFICKYPEKENGRADGAKQFVAWHQDVRYWGVDGDVVTAWLAVDKADLQNGCMQVIPGSHRNGILDHRNAERAGNLLTSNQEIPTSLFDVSKAVACPLEPGQMSLHHGHTVHGSEPNLSNRRRCGYVIRYVGTSSRPSESDPDRPRTFPATVLVSGKDDYHHFPDHAPKWFSRNI